MGALHGSEPKRGPHKAAGETGPNYAGNLSCAFDAHRRAEWLEVIKQCGRRAVANVRIGVSRGTVEKALKEEEFRVAFEDAMLFFRESLVSEAVRRAVRGLDEPVFSRGARAMDIHPEDVEMLEALRAEGKSPRMIPATIRRYSDTLLQSLLKAHLPEFADKAVVNQKPGEQPGLDLDELTPEELDELQGFLKKVQERKRAAADGTTSDVS